MKTLSIIVGVSFMLSSAFAQEIDYTQYYLTLAGVNPGFTGIEDYLDVKVGTRQGWNNFGEKNSNVYVSAYGTLKNANLSPLVNSPLRLSNSDYYKEIISDKRLRRKLGIGGMITGRDIGLYKSVSILTNYAYHLPISRKFNWTLGAKVGYVNQKINLAGYTVRDEINDSFYQQLIKANQGTENLVLADFGSTLYTDRIYLAVSSSNLLMRRLGGFNLFNSAQSPRYSVQAGGNVKLGKDFKFYPGFKLTASSEYGIHWTINSRLKYMNLIYGGISYENDIKVSTLFGLFVNSSCSIHYAYDKYLTSLNNFNVSVHEVVVGMSLFNRYGLNSKFW